MADRYHTEHSTCTPCTVLCGHKGTYPDGVKRPIPEYETIGLWGGNLDNYDPDTVGSWNVLLNDFGIDTISCGVTVGWAMEAAEKNLRPSELAFGKTDNIAAMIENIAYRRGEGEELGLGSKRLSEKYGGVDFAIHVKGMEMAAYDPRAAWGQALNYAVANRGGCHLNAYPVALEVFFGFLIPYTTVSKALWVDFLENLYSAINSTHTCLFTGFGYLLEPPIAKYTPSFLLKFFMTWTAPIAKLFLDWSAISDVTGAVLGWNLSKGEYFKIGRRVHVLERHMNVLMGITSADDKLPGRFINEANTKHSVKKAVNLEPMIKAYYKIKGYDNNGAPTTKLLRKLGIVTNMGNN